MDTITLQIAYTALIVLAYGFVCKSLSEYDCKATQESQDFVGWTIIISSTVAAIAFIILTWS